MKDNGKKPKGECTKDPMTCDYSVFLEWKSLTGLNSRKYIECNLKTARKNKCHYQCKEWK
jgi:hypothetical protein